VAPFVAINFTSYEMLRQWAIDARQGEKPSLFVNLSIGALAGTIAMSITYPSELLRRRMMLQVQTVSCVVCVCVVCVVCVLCVLCVVC
jgi:hypothetical protein